MDTETPKDKGETEKIEEWTLLTEEEEEEQEEEEEEEEAEDTEEKRKKKKKRTPIVKPKKDRSKCPFCDSVEIYEANDVEGAIWCKNCKRVFEWEEED